MFRILKEFLSYLEVYNGDKAALLLNVIGGILIGITFLIIGLVYIAMSYKAIAGRRKRLTTLFGLFLISCSFSRFFSVICTWNNYAIADGWLKILTGVLAVLAIIYIPKTIKEVLADNELTEAYKMLEKTQKDLHEVKKISEKLDNK